MNRSRTAPPPLGPVDALARWGRRRAAPLLRPAVVAYRHRGVRSDDAVLASYPRSGATWTRMMLGHVLAGRPSDYKNISGRIPYIGSHAGADAYLAAGGRVLWTHELRMVPSTKIIYLVRDPRSVVLSLYRYLLMVGEIDTDLRNFVRRFVSREPGFWYGRWDRHVSFWCDARPQDVLLVRFEDLKVDPAGAIASMSSFLGVARSDDDIAEAVADNTLESMRLKELASGFRRHRDDLRGVGSGEADGWRTELADDDAAAILDRFGARMTALRYE